MGIPTGTFNPGDLIAKVVNELLKDGNTAKIGKLLQLSTEESIKTIVAAFLNMAGPIAQAIGRGLVEGENEAQGVFDDLAALGIEDLLGVSVGGGGFARRGGAGGRRNVGNAVGAAILQKVAGNQSQLTPSTAQAEEFLGTMASFAIEGWLEGWVVEFLTSIIPGVGNIETFGELDDIMANVMGFGRLSRRVMSPLIDATTVTPMEWHVNKTYRPRLLSTGEIARQVARGRWTREEGTEELARQGYSNERIEALFNAARKFHSVADVAAMIRAELWTHAEGVQHLRDQGYEAEAAETELRIERLKAISAFERQLANEAARAYVDGQIGGAELREAVRSATLGREEEARIVELAEVRRRFNTRRLSLSQVEAMVKSGVASVLDYREAARRDGYPEGDVMQLELQLRYELDRQSDIEALRRQAAAEREAERQARAAREEERRRQLEAERARGGQAPLSKFERAAVRGLIPFSQLEAELAAQYAPDDVAVVMALVEADRADYVAQQERAALAENGARLRGVSLGDLRAALFAGTLDQQGFRVRLGQLGFAAGDVDLLTATAVAELEKRREAERTRREATDTATRRRIDLPRFEMLVRRGARTMTQYAALLADLGFDDVDQAALVDLLNIKIADDVAAREARDRAAGELAARGLSLEQIERAVILGVRTIDDYQRFLLEQRFTPDAQLALVALLRVRVDEANAARARRQATDAGSGGLELPIATIRRAARLGVISPDVYVARLERDGYAADDVAIDLELLLLEIADVQAARATRDEAERAAAARQLSLATIEQAVKRGLAPIDAYRARAAELGYTGAELELLVDLLVDELAELEAARARRGVIDGELRTRNLSVAQLEEAVKKGLGALDDFAGELRALGYGDEDAQLLSALLAIDLETAPPATGG